MSDPLLPLEERPAERARARRREPRLRFNVGRLVIALVVLAVVVVLLIVGLAKVVGKLTGSDVPDYKGNGTDPVIVQITEGSSVSQIGDGLKNADVVKSRQAFVDAARKNDVAARKLQPGYYRLRKQMSGQAAFNLLIDPAAKAESKFTLPEGLSVHQALPIISKGTGIPVADLQAAAKDTKSLGLPSYAKGAEGFLFPATYEFAPNAKATDVLRTMVERFDSEASSMNLTAAAKAHHITPLQLVTLASIVEREVRNDRGKAATVLYNRLKDTKDFPTLGLDSTVRYALGDYPGPLKQSQLDIDSPYNTRKYPGIPPGPIGNPGTAALQAVAQPTPGPWLYFLSLPKEDKTYYVTTSAEFDDLRKKLAAQGGAGGY